jgi:gamma-tubulin complex component 4
VGGLAAGAVHSTSFYGLHGGNGVGVFLELDAAGAQVAVKGCSHSTQALGSLGAHPTAVPEQTLAQAALLRRPLPDTGHWLLVEYDASDAAAPVLRVYFDDPHKKGPPVLETPLALHKALALDATDAAAVAVHAALTAGDRHSRGVGGAPLPAVKVAVHDWTFSAHKAASHSGTSSTSSTSSSSSSSNASALERSLDVGECWDDLRASYAVAWPLNLVLTADAAEVCGQLFALLWPVKRVCVDLEQLWPHLMEAKYRQLPKANNVWLRPLQTLHGRMLFFVRNLQVYLQVDVVEVQHQTLLASVQAHPGDFDAVRRAHAHFLASILAKSHVGVRPLVDGLKRLLRLGRHFVSLVLSYSNAADIPHAEVAALAERFQTDSTYLFLMLDRTDAKELSARLDFNGWHSATATALTGSI